MNEVSRVIAFRCRGSEKYSRIVYNALTGCGFSAGIDSFEGNTAFVLLSGSPDCAAPKEYTAEIIVCDDDTEPGPDMPVFRAAVTDHENAAAAKAFAERVFTFSEKLNEADLSCRSFSRQDGALVADLISGGILSRVKVKREDMSVRDVLLCSAVLIAAGVPIASAVDRFG